jgi:hypothetical protein
MSFSFCAIAITFWYVGIGPGVLALVLAVLIRTFLFQPAENELESRVALWGSGTFNLSSLEFPAAL